MIGYWSPSFMDAVVAYYSVFLNKNKNKIKEKLVKKSLSIDVDGLKWFRTVA